jgi:hypothetical protein
MRRVTTSLSFTYTVRFDPSPSRCSDLDSAYWPSTIRLATHRGITNPLLDEIRGAVKVISTGFEHVVVRI